MIAAWVHNLVMNRLMGSLNSWSCSYRYLLVNSIFTRQASHYLHLVEELASYLLVYYRPIRRSLAFPIAPALTNSEHLVLGQSSQSIELGRPLPFLCLSHQDLLERSQRTVQSPNSSRKLVKVALRMLFSLVS